MNNNGDVCVFLGLNCVGGTEVGKDHPGVLAVPSLNGPLSCSAVDKQDFLENRERLQGMSAVQLTSSFFCFLTVLEKQASVPLW